MIDIIDVMIYIVLIAFFVFVIWIVSLAARIFIKKGDVINERKK